MDSGWKITVWGAVDVRCIVEVLSQGGVMHLLVCIDQQEGF